jgi:ElaB/YqjD/DUF883 family membrane-anchored ribosome-binding protein
LSILAKPSRNGLEMRLTGDFGAGNRSQAPGPAPLPCPALPGRAEWNQLGWPQPKWSAHHLGFVQEQAMSRHIYIVLLLLLLGGCESAYYNVMERFGVEKREILVDRVVAARDAQEVAQDQFSSALDQFKAVVEVEDSELETVYRRLEREFNNSEAAANRIRTRIRDVESVADALFREWNDELKQYRNEQLRRDSERQLRETRDRYQQLLGAMQRAETRMEPVLDAMRDQTLYLKHNLNARAIQTLRGEVVRIDRDVDALLEAMKQAIAEADAFVRAMRPEAASVGS